VPKPQNLEVELELTYLACEIPAETKYVQPKRLLDIYVPENSDRPFIRLRQKGNEYEITKKKPINDDDVSSQTEQTIPLDQDEFEALAAVSSRKVEKDRYKVTIDGHVAEVDIFDGPLKGLIVIDFEFDSEEAKHNFRPPSCCLVEVTQERFIAGGQLAGKSYADIEADLTRYNYKKL
jgi:CYTH domain-containing protein